MSQVLKYMLSISICALVSITLQAQDNTLNEVELSFTDVLQKGLNNNYDIKLQNFAVESARYENMTISGYLNPYFKTDATLGLGVDPTFTNDGTQYIQTNFVKPTKLGIDFYTGVRFERTDLINEGFLFNSSGIWAGASIPLLRGLGKNSQVNTALRTSKLNIKASNQSLSNEMMNYFSRLLQTYLSLKRNERLYNIETNALNESEDYQKDITRLIEGDMIPKVEKNRANTLVRQNQQSQNSAVINIQNAYFDLQNIMGNSMGNDRDILPRTDNGSSLLNLQYIKNYLKNLQRSSIDSLVKKTPLYKALAINREVNKIETETAKNQKLNRLNLDVKVSRFGMFQNGPYDLEETIFSPYPGYSGLISLSYDLPINNETQRGKYLKQLTEYEMSKTKINRFTFEQKTAVKRLITTIQQQLKLYERSVNLASDMKQLYEDEQEKFKYGSATQIDVILSMNNFFQAQKSVVKLRYGVLIDFVELKYLLGEVPENTAELQNFNLSEYFNANE